MAAFLVLLAAHHSIGFVVTALVICLVAGWLLAVLLRQAERTTTLARRWWLAGIAVIAGLGVWTTHFIAMLGYRSDIALDYAVGTTAGSALLGILAVGLPLTLSAVVGSTWARTACGIVAGLGIGAMHFTGMAAIGGCTQTHAPFASLFACVVGALALALARGLPQRLRSHAATCLLFTAGVCGAHFTAIAGTTLTSLPQLSGARGDTITLSIFTAAGAIVIFLGAFVSVLAAKRFEAQERAHSTILSTALHNMSNGLLFIDEHCRVGLFNDRYLQMFGLQPGQLANGMSLDDLLTAVCRAQGWDEALRRGIGDTILSGVRSLAAHRCDQPMPDGHILDVEVRPVPGGGAVLTFDDVTSDREAKGHLSRLAFLDPLTGLANRHALQVRMEERGGAALLLVDLDRFKIVNDTHGHGVGDRLLVEVARRLRVTAGSEGIAARIGGDELAVLVPVEAASETAEAILRTLSQPFELGAVSLVVGCSIGIAAEAGVLDALDLMRRADIALYEAKRGGRGRACHYRSGMLEAATARHRLEADLREAIARSELHLAYQPVLSLAEDRIIGYEALIRWNHPVHGAVPPADFIPLAEETGQILAIGRWVLDTACREAAGWADGRHVAVNVSPIQLRSPSFPAHVAAALAESGLAPGRLEVELTETAMVEDGALVAATLANLRTLGVRVAMDDFGTGYSSLAHLRDFPLDRIKIDRSFVAAASGDRHSMAVLVAITQMGKALAIPTLAEGVETDEELQLLRTLGCDAVQGYLIGRPERLSPERDAQDRPARRA